MMRTHPSGSLQVRVWLGLQQHSTEFSIDHTPSKNSAWCGVAHLGPTTWWDSVPMLGLGVSS
jgi:hypothetical protein